MSPERAFEIAKREILRQLPGLPEAAIMPSVNPNGARVETRYLTLVLYYRNLPRDSWVCWVNSGEVKEEQFSVEFVLQLALDGWRNLLNQRVDRLDQYTSPPDLD